MVSLYFGGERGGNGGGEMLNGNFGSQVDTGIVQWFLDEPK